jgi:hypothetical protein
MNVLYDYHDARGMDARKAKATASIDHDEVIGLALANLVEAQRQRSGQLVDIPSAVSTLLYVGGHILRLTNLGTLWVQGNLTNRLLRAVDSTPQGRYDLRDALQSCEDDAVIVGVVSDGYATLHYKGDTRETRFIGNGREQFAHGADYVLIATSKIRTVLGPKA